MALAFASARTRAAGARKAERGAIRAIHDEVVTPRCAPASLEWHHGATRCAASKERSLMNSITRSAGVAQAIEVYRNVAACKARIAGGGSGNVHALAAALMLPCYQAEFRRLALELDEVEGRALRSALAAWPVALNPSIPPASAGTAPCPATPLPVPARPA